MKCADNYPREMRWYENWSLITLFCAVDARFLIGFVVPLFWYYGTYLFYTERYHDPREWPGLAACAIAVCAHSVSCYILNPIICLQIRTQCMAWPQSSPDVMSEIYNYSYLRSCVQRVTNTEYMKRFCQNQC